jgi:hypothetical protein
MRQRLFLPTLLLLFSASTRMTFASEPGTLSTVEIYQELNSSTGEPTFRIMDIWDYKPGAEILAKIKELLKKGDPAYYLATEAEILAGKTASGASIGDHTRYLLPPAKVPDGATKFRVDRAPSEGEEKIRVSIASGVRILIPGEAGSEPKYLLLANRGSLKKGVVKYAPVGGAYNIRSQSLDSWKSMIEELNESYENAFVAERDPEELRFKLEQWKMPYFLDFAMSNKEATPMREIIEELVEESPIIPQDMMLREVRTLQMQINPRDPYTAEEKALMKNNGPGGSDFDRDSHLWTAICQENLAKAGKTKPSE